MAVCNDDLKCVQDMSLQKYVYYTFTRSKLGIIEKHHFCYSDDLYRNNGKYDVIDRSDEDNINIETVNKINYTSFTECYKGGGVIAGVMCGDECLASFSWCKEDAGYGLTAQNCNNNVSTTNPELCSNHTFWENIPCTYASDASVQTYGHRCTGSMKSCVLPWYTWSEGKCYPIYEQSCEDKSDQIFPQNITCHQYNQLLLNEHNKLFCNDTFVMSKQICTDPQSWLLQQDIPDIHKCQDSCIYPEPSCVTCQNPEYFQCKKSGKCIHPDLHCDGHPQCSDSEDEDLGKCYQKYLKRKVLDTYATVKCKSIMYSNLTTVATACNDVIECVDAADEQSCSADNDSLLLSTSACVIILFWILRIAVYLDKKLKMKNERYELRKEQFLTALKKYEIKHNDTKTIKQIGSFLQHVLHSNTAFNKNKFCTLFYNIESKIHEDDEAEVWCCIHNRLDPKVAGLINDEVNPGVKTAIINALEKNCISYWLTNILDKIGRNVVLGRIIYFISNTLSVELVYIDMFKARMHNHGMNESY